MIRRSGNPIQGKFVLKGKQIDCPHCTSAEFLVGEAQLNTALMTLIELDWIDKKATTLTCTSCGRIQWFAQAPERES